MTVLVSISVIALFFLVPFLAGNIYSVVFRKKTIGIAGLYLSGMAIVYALLFVLQLAIIKLKLDFAKVSKLYHLFFLIFLTLGTLCFLWKLFKQKNVTWDIIWSKKAIFIYALIVLQGVLYIALKNPYFENNALLETTKITMETGTIYEYNAFTKQVAAAGFPLSNKLMFLPVLYAYISNTFGINPSILFNFVVPVVTFLSFYLVMNLWVQKLGKEHNISWKMLLLVLVWTIQAGDAWSHSTAFRVLHTGYMGEAIFFGIIFAYALYSIENKCYFISLVCLLTFPGLIKYDAVFDFIKGFGGYWKEAATYSGMLVIFIIAAVYYVVSRKKISTHLLNLNLTICFAFSEIRNRVMKKETAKWHRIASGTVLVLLLLMCGNLTVISDATQWRSNSYGAPKEEYELLESLATEEKEEPLRIMAYDEVNRWICRLDFNILPVVGYDFGGEDIGWYSYETYDERHTKLWETIRYSTVDMEDKLMELKEEIPMDYIIVRRITKEIPIQNNKEIQCVQKTASYLVYSVDKK